MSYGYETHPELSTLRPLHHSFAGYDQINNCFSGDVDFIPLYGFTAENFHIVDPVWGQETIGGQPGDELLLRLAGQAAFQRLQAVEQLSLPEMYSTIPNTAAFSRWEHIWGSAVLARRLARQHDVDADTSLRLQLRTLVSDVGQTAGSHIGDWLFQGIGEGENLHDLELHTYLEATGVNRVLRQAGIQPQEVIFPDVPADWVEAPAPDLCIDRMDYGLREMKRWVPISSRLRHFYSENGGMRNSGPDLVIGEDNQMHMTDPEKAVEFARAFMLLGQEHWSEPIHRLQLTLFMERIKRVFVDEHTGERWTQYHPRDVIYFADPEYKRAMQEHDPFGAMLGSIMADIARYQRTFGWLRRKAQLESHMLGSPRVGYMDDHPEHHAMVAIEDIPEDADIPERPGCISILLPNFKMRMVDPPVTQGSQTVRASVLSAQLRQELADHSQQSAVRQVAHLAVPDNRTLRLLREGLQYNRAVWPKLLEKPRMDPEQLQMHIAEASLLYGTTSPSLKPL